MDLSSVPSAFKEAVGTFEAFRKLGFTPDEIKYHLNPDGNMFVLLEAQGKSFAVAVGQVSMTVEQWKQAWSDLITAINDGSVPQQDLDAWWACCRPHIEAAAFLEALIMKGIDLPNAIRRWNALSN